MNDPSIDRQTPTGRLAMAAALLGLLLAIGLVLAAWQVGQSLIAFRKLDRSVEVKGLSEREVPANLAIWPISYSEADNDVSNLYRTLESKNARLVAFLQEAGFKPEEISVSPPSVVDKLAREYGGEERSQFRYTARSTVTVYTPDVARVRGTMNRVAELGRQGLATGGDQGAHTEFLFTELNSIKPEMLEEATRNAREAATKFANDSGSHLGKIRRASQGQFSISDRDASTPYIKKVRVVSTVDYYLAD
jgi:hypothetical protein